MPISHDNNNCSQGFTLVEILVVIVIVGIMTGLAVLSVGGNPQRELQKEARRLQMVLHTAADEALMQGREFGLLTNRETYQVLVFDIQQRQWIPSELKAFSSYQLPSQISLAVTLEGEAVDLLNTDEEGLDKDQDKDKEDRAGETPELLFFSSGEASAFSISLRHENLKREMLLLTDGIEDVRIELADE